MLPHERTAQHRSPRLRDAGERSRPDRAPDSSPSGRDAPLERGGQGAVAERPRARRVVDWMDDDAAGTSAEARARRRPVDDWMAGGAPSSGRAPHRRPRPADDWTAETPARPARPPERDFEAAARLAVTQAQAAGTAPASARQPGAPVRQPGAQVRQPTRVTPLQATSEPGTGSPPQSASSVELATAGAVPARRTITIRGHGAERSRAARPYDHLERRRTRDRGRHHKPDRIAMWAVLLASRSRSARRPARTPPCSQRTLR